MEHMNPTKFLRSFIIDLGPIRNDHVGEASAPPTDINAMKHYWWENIVSFLP